jgi:hypothetical protein
LGEKPPGQNFRRFFFILNNSRKFLEKGLTVGIYFAPSFSHRDPFGNGGVK